MAHASCQYIMLRTEEMNGMSERRCCTREQARELLEALRAAYQSVSPEIRALVKIAIASRERAEIAHERYEEKECFELA